MMQPRDLLLDTLADQGWVAADDLVSGDLCMQLLDECTAAWDQGLFRQAGIGHGSRVQTHTEVRGDSILWLESESAHGATARFLELADQLRCDLNRHFFLGLNNAEFHFARYPAGGGYKQHLDQHQGQPFRKISLVLYLNPDWRPEDQGELCIVNPSNHSDVTRILPQRGRLVLFRSDSILHEVRPCQKTRWSLTGWFRSDPSPWK